MLQDDDRVQGDPRTVPATFTLSELWLLQACIRHEVLARGTWHYPPGSLALSDQIAEALHVCERDRRDNATLLLTRGDTLVIDYCVPQAAKDSQGFPVGKNVLIKNNAARFTLAGGDLLDATEPLSSPSKAEVIRRLANQGDDRADTY